MNRDTQLQLLDRLDSKVVSLPHVFIEGQYLGVSLGLVRDLLSQDFKFLSQEVYIKWRTYYPET